MRRSFIALCSSLVVAASVAPAAHAQVVLVSQNRVVGANANCTGVPVSQSFTAPDFGPFNRTASATSTFDANRFASMSAAQNTTLSTSSFAGSLSTSQTSRMCGGGSAVSFCTVVFQVNSPVRITSLIGTNTAGGISVAPCNLRLTGPNGVVFNHTIAPGMDVNMSGQVLPNGTYTFHAAAASLTSSPGSSMFTSSGMNFTFSVAALRLPLTTGPVITNPATCHRYVALEPSNWLAAAQAARDLGGYLVSFETLAENVFVVNQFADPDVDATIIGLSDLQLDGSFVWESGAPLTVTNWLPGEPQAGRPHVFMNTPGRWFTDTDEVSQAITRGIVELEDCIADWNEDGVVTSPDFFAFLIDFFAGNADVDCSQTTTSEDFFAFIAAFFVGCA